MARIGFCCKWLDPVTGTDHELGTRATTVAWLNRQSRDVAEQRLWDIMVDNLKATQLLVEKVGTFDDSLRMVRIGSDLLPMYTQRDWSYFWHRGDVVKHCETSFAEIGRTARDRDVRLSMHPGQFCVLASDNEDIVDRSIEEFEYHVDMARWMGYGSTWQDFKINVHLSGRAGPEKFIKTLGKLTPEARNMITIENDEMSNGLDVTLQVAKHVPLVLDIHHHWINSGEYIETNDKRIETIKSSWRGVRPVIHYSVSREDYLVGHPTHIRPNLEQLIAQGYKKQKLRAHSEFYWNSAVNEWAMSFADDFDIQCESKAKNLASFAFAAGSQILLEKAA
jgi:UV DNA damage endonuclease